MEKRQIGTSDLYVSKMGLGCMSLGTDQHKAQNIIHYALDHGINYLDTADLYDFGANEEIVGNAIRGKRDSVIVATKVGNRWNDVESGWRWDPSKNYIKSAVKDSLHRLKLNYIDLYQAHGGTIEDNIDETIEAFEELKKEGLIRYYGISSIRPNVIKYYLQNSSLVSIMMQYSLLDRRPEEWLSLLAEHNVNVIARGPVAKGLLTERILAKASDKIKEQGYLNYSFAEVKEITDKMKNQFGSTKTVNALALQYILSHPEVSAVIPGASSIEQLQENIEAASATPLESEELAFLKSITKQSKYDQHRD